RGRAVIGPRPEDTPIPSTNATTTSVDLDPSNPREPTVSAADEEEDDDDDDDDDYDDDNDDSNDSSNADLGPSQQMDKKMIPISLSTTSAASTGKAFSPFMTDMPEKARRTGAEHIFMRWKTTLNFR
ncbi:hypothetical protein HDU96_004107, partial [Phlyctochytrium bullatum]